MKTEEEPIHPHLVHTNSGEVQEYSKGLTKREYFAGLAMQGLCAYNGTMNEHTIESTVKRSIEIADELIKQLEV